MERQRPVTRVRKSGGERIGMYERREGEEQLRFGMM